LSEVFILIFLDRGKYCVPTGLHVVLNSHFYQYFVPNGTNKEYRPKSLQGRYIGRKTNQENTKSRQGRYIVRKTKRENTKSRQGRYIGRKTNQENTKSRQGRYIGRKTNQENTKSRQGRYIGRKNQATLFSPPPGSTDWFCNFTFSRLIPVVTFLIIFRL
jgi:hypothetical protein